MNIKTTKNLMLVLGIALLLLPLLISCAPSKDNAGALSVTYITTTEEFKNAIISGKENIFVGDLQFENPETLVLNHTVNIVGKSETSVIKNLHLQIYGSASFENKIKISLENIVFDGCFDKTAYDLTQEKSFDELFGEENDNVFLSADKDIGYYDLYVNFCEFTNYAGWWGAAIRLPLNKSNNGEKIVTIKNSKFYGNVGAERIVDIYDNQIKINVENVEMFDNYAVSKIANLTNVFVDINGLNVRDNHFIPLDSLEYYNASLAYKNDRNMIRGGGVYFGNAKGLVKNMTVENNETFCGGGIFVALGWEGQSLTFADCTFKNNKAKVYGGAVGVESHVGYPIYFTNCLFVGNHAPKGGSICAMPFFFDRKDGNTSMIEFSFCDFSGNTADDDNALAYYYDGFTKTKKDGKIIVNGCRIEDATFLSGNGEKENNYNIVSPTAVSGNQSVQIQADEYTSWANGYYAGDVEIRRVGYTAFATQTELSNADISIVQPIFYGLCAMISVIIALFYLFKSTERHVEMILIAFAVAIINFGYLMLSVSWNLNSALAFNNVAYLGNAMLPLFFTIAIANVCRFKVHKAGKIILTAVSAINFIFTLTVWFSDLFYLNPLFAIIDGAVDIVKSNGPLHTAYVVYVFAYFLIIFGIVLYSLIKKRLKHKHYAILIFSAELVCLLVWAIELLAPFNFELLSVAFVLTSSLLSVLFLRMERNGILMIDDIVSLESKDGESLPGEIVASDTYNYDKHFVYPNEIEFICRKLADKKTLTMRETEILALLLQGKSAAAISEILFVSVNTVKSHAANIYKKLSVRTREELRYRVISELQE